MPIGVYIRSEQNIKNITKANRKRARENLGKSNLEIWRQNNPEKAIECCRRGGKASNGLGPKIWRKNNPEKWIEIQSMGGKAANGIGLKIWQKSNPEKMLEHCRENGKITNCRFLWFPREIATVYYRAEVLFEV